MRRVAITGLGSISCLGNNADAAWASMSTGRGGIGPIIGIDGPALLQPIAGQVHDFDPTAHCDPKRWPLMDRVSAFAIVAAREAMRQARLELRRDSLAARMAVIVGTGAGGENSHDQQMRRLYGGDGRVHPLTILRVMANAPASHLSIEFGITGPVFGVTSACASSNHALAQAFQMVRSGQADAALAGGTEACITYSTLKAWEAMRVMADDACRPFSRHRRGMVLAEGAAMFVLEPLEAARARGVEVLAEFAGAGMSADAADLVMPAVSGAAAAMQRALDDAQLAPQSIGYINAHGTGTAANDPTETAAIRRVFGPYADSLSVSSTKAMHGHALGAAGALELVATVNALRFGIIPPTINFLEPDPQCDLDYTANSPINRAIEAALSNSFAFGGLNAVIALRRA